MLKVYEATLSYPVNLDMSMQIEWSDCVRMQIADRESQMVIVALRRG